MGVVSPLFLDLSVEVSYLRILLLHEELDDGFKVRMLGLLDSVVIEVHVAVEEPAIWKHGADILIL